MDLNDENHTVGSVEAQISQKDRNVEKLLAQSKKEGSNSDELKIID